MSSTDDRIVRMQFDNAQFKKGAAETKKSLDDVNKAVDSSGKGKGLMDLGGQMETVKVKAGAMQVAAVTALANITNRAVDAGLALAKSFTLDPIRQGFDEYELKMKSIQTILANTNGENLKSVTRALNELNTYSDQTIYNFANMTENIGKMTTAGIDLKTATATVKGFSNMVALSGGSAQASAGALEQFVQGLQAGVIKAMDWQSLATRGLGSQALQRAFFETARAAGKLQDIPLTTTFEEWAKANGGFKGSLEQGWLTAETATQTLKIMTGDVKNIQDLMKQGFDRKTAKDMLEIADNALESATKVRTFTAFIDTLKEQIGSGWSQVFETIVGDFNEATDLFTGLSNITGDAIGGFFNYITATLKAWDEMGGRTAILNTIKNLLAPIGATLQVISAAWTAAFPSNAGGGALYAISKGLELITTPLSWLASGISALTPAMTTFFQLFSIGRSILVSVGEKIGEFVEDLLSLASVNLSGTGSGFLGFVKDVGSAIADAVDEVDSLLRKGASLTQAFGAVDINLPSMPSMPSLPSLGSIFGGGESEKATSQFDETADSVKGLADNMDGLGDAASDAKDTMSSAGEGAVSLGKKIWEFFGTVVDGAKELMGMIDGQKLVESFNMAILATVGIQVGRLINSITNGISGFASIGDSFNGVLETTQGTLENFGKSMQRQATADLILKTGIALGILAASLWLLSTIPMKRMASALTGLGLASVILNKSVKSMADLFKTMNNQGLQSSVNMIAVSIALTALAASLVLLSTAMLIMNKVEWSSVLKGLLTMTVLMEVLKQLGEQAEESWKPLLGSAAALIGVSIAMGLLAGALMLFSMVKWEDMGKAAAALAGVTIALGGLALLFKSGGGAALLAAAGGAMAGAALGMNALATALMLFDKVQWDDMGKAGAALVGLALGLTMMAAGALAGPMMPLMAAGLIGLAIALMMFENVDWSAIPKLTVALVALAVGLGVLTPVLYLAAPALAIFAASVALLGAGLLAFVTAAALAVTIAGVASVAFSALAVAAVTAIAIFLQTLAAQAPVMKDSILATLQTMIDGIVEAVPMVVDGIKRLWTALMRELTGNDKKKDAKKTGGEMTKEFAKGLEDKIPQIVHAANRIIVKFLNAMAEDADDVSAAAVGLMVAWAEGINKKLDAVIKTGADIVITFIKGISKEMPRIADAAIDAAVDFMDALADTIERRAPELGAAMARLGIAMVQGLVSGVTSMMETAKNKIGELAEGMVNRAKSILEIFSPSRVFKRIGKFLVEGLTKGVQDNAASAITAVASMLTGAIALSTDYVNKFIQKLDQQAIQAKARAQGLADAAKQATKAARRSDSKRDDKAAKDLREEAKKAAKQARKEDQEAKQARKKAAARRRWNKADDAERAKIRSGQARSALNAAKQAEQEAERQRVYAKELRKMAKEEGLTAKERKRLRNLADKAEEEAKDQAQKANKNIKTARQRAKEARDLQLKAGKDAAENIQEQYEAEAKAADDAEKFEKMTSAEKAEELRKQAAASQKTADTYLEKAKKKALTDIAAANSLAEIAYDAAEKARNLIDQAEEYEAQGGTGQVLALDPAAAAAAAFGEYENRYNESYAAAARGSTVEFNQYNTSPESLTADEIYRQTNNLITYAADKVSPAA